MIPQSFAEFMANPTTRGLEGAREDDRLLPTSTPMRSRRITAGEARSLAGFSPRMLEGLPDDYRCPPPAWLKDQSQS